MFAVRGDSVGEARTGHYSTLCQSASFAQCAVPPDAGGGNKYRISTIAYCAVQCDSSGTMRTPMQPALYSSLRAPSLAPGAPVVADPTLHPAPTAPLTYVLYDKAFNHPRYLGVACAGHVNPRHELSQHPPAE